MTSIHITLDRKTTFRLMQVGSSPHEFSSLNIGESFSMLFGGFGNDCLDQMEELGEALMKYVSARRHTAPEMEFAPTEADMTDDLQYCEVCKTKENYFVLADGELDDGTPACAHHIEKEAQGTAEREADERNAQE